MSRRARTLLLLGVGVYLASLLATLPAGLLLRALGEQAPSAAGWHGSIWSGGARGLVLAGRQYGDLEWALQPAALLGGALGARFAWRAGTSRADGELRVRARDDLELRAAHFESDLPALAALAGQRDAPVTGRLTIERGAALRWQAGRVSGLECQGSVTGIELRRASGLALGDLSLRCEADESGPRVHIEDRGGPLAVQAQVSLAEPGRWALDARLGARPQTPALVRQALPLLGAPDGPERVRVRLSGELPVVAGRSP